MGRCGWPCLVVGVRDAAHPIVLRTPPAGRSHPPPHPEDVNSAEAESYEEKRGV